MARQPHRHLTATVLVGLAALVAGCSGSGEPVAPAPATSPSIPSSATPSPSAVAVPDAPAPAFVVRYVVAVDADGLDRAEVAGVLQAVLTDPRGWSRAGFVFVPEGPDAPASDLPVVTITVAEGPVIDARCRPYDTFGRYSCQRGATVNLNADRWRDATPEWRAVAGDDLVGYRTYLINHEVGHVLGLHHPRPQCPGPGYPAPVMLQQSTELGDCTPNPWPLTWEVELAASRVEPFAPGYEPDPQGRPSPPPVRS